MPCLYNLQNINPIGLIFKEMTQH